MNKFLFLFLMSFVCGFMICGPVPGVLAADGLVVSNIQPAYVEKGATNYTVTMRAIVTNNTENEGVAIDISGLDKDGYILENMTLTGKIKPGQRRVVLKMVTMPKENYEKIVKWVEKK